MIKKETGSMEGFIIRITRDSIFQDFYCKNLFCCSNNYQDYIHTQIIYKENLKIPIPRGLYEISYNDVCKYSKLRINESTLPLIYHQNIYVKMLGYKILEGLR